MLNSLLFGKHSLKASEKLVNTAVAFALKITNIKLVLFIFTVLTGYQFYSEPSLSWATLFFSCIVTPIWEELFFRKAPLDIAIAADKKKYLIPAIILSSAIFGIMHGNGIFSIMLQGVGGAILSVLYVKNGQDIKYNILAHALWNLAAALAFI